MKLRLCTFVNLNLDLTFLLLELREFWIETLIYILGADEVS